MGHSSPPAMERPFTSIRMLHCSGVLDSLGMRFLRFFHQLITEESTAVLSHFSTQNLSNTLWSLARIPTKTYDVSWRGPVLERLSERGLQSKGRVRSGGEKGRSTSIPILAVLVHTKMIPCVLPSLSHLRPSLVIDSASPQHLSTMLWSLANVVPLPGPRSRDLAEALGSRAHLALHKGVDVGLANGLWGCSVGLLPKILAVRRPPSPRC